MRHIVNQFLLHFGLSAPITLIISFLLLLLVRKVPEAQIFLSTNRLHLAVVSALLVAGTFPLREIVDIYKGNNTFLKSWFDVASWWLGSAAVVVLLYFLYGG